jgi:hypothetical protein
MADFVMQVQQEDEWCWAAVAVSIHSYLNPDSEPAWTQATLATKVLQEEGTIPATVNCSVSPDLCDCTAPLSTAFTTTGNFSKTVAAPLSFASLKQQLDNGIPVCAQIDWFDGGAHAIALDGYQIYTSGEQAVVVQDPLNRPSIQFYEDLVSDYPPGGTWSNTFLVKA